MPAVVGARTAKCSQWRIATDDFEERKRQMIEQLDQKLSQLKSIRSGLLQIPPELKSELDLTSKSLHANHATKSRVGKMLPLDESQRPSRRKPKISAVVRRYQQG